MKRRLSLLVIAIGVILLLHGVWQVAAAAPPQPGDYWSILAMLPVIVGGIAAFLSPDSRQQRTVKTIIPNGSWYELDPIENAGLNSRIVYIVAIVWNVVTFTTLWHYKSN